MNRSIVLLRGINVGGHNPLSMELLRSTLTNSGYADVRTLLQSGNIAISSSRPVTGDHLRAILAEHFGLEVPVVVLSPAEVEVIAMRNPFVADESDLSRLHVFFFDRTPDASGSVPLDPVAFAPDRFAIEGRALYAHFPNGAARTKLTVGVVERALGVTATARNMKTVMKLIAL
jgi:uncharacterized protein (DUF1697 family)